MIPKKLKSKINTHMLRQYVRHKLHARYWRGHGVHSPFVYDLVRHVITTRQVDRTLRSHMRRFRKQLLHDKREIMFEDFGTGVNRMRTVSEMANHVSTNERYGMLLARMVKAYKPASIVELGTSLGIGTAYMAMASKQTPVTTIEGCKACADIARDNMRKLGLQNVNVICGEFDKVLPGVLEKQGTNFIFIDGNHTEEATLRYFEMCCKAAHVGTIIIFDDIHWSAGMSAAWEKIHSDTRVQTSLDLFRLGMVFFRSGCPKQHYQLRF